MSRTRRRISGAPGSATGPQRCSRTGWPMRAIFNMAMRISATSPGYGFGVLRTPCYRARPRPGSPARDVRKEGEGGQVQVLVRDNNVDQALKALKKKMQREGIFREMKLRGHYEKPSEKKAREKAEAIRRARKLARKKLQREGLLPSKPRPAPGAGGPGRGAPRFG